MANGGTYNLTADAILILDADSGDKPCETFRFGVETYSENDAEVCIPHIHGTDFLPVKKGQVVPLSAGANVIRKVYARGDGGDATAYGGNQAVLS